MIGKVTVGSNFGGVVRYVIEKQEATLLMAEGVRKGEVQAMIQDFNMQRKVNPDLTKLSGISR
jgi:hypothetical protein